MTIQVIPVPDLGGADKVEVIEVCVKPGDVIGVEQSLVVLESDKASMEIPSPSAGKVVSLKVKEGDSLSVGDAILELEIEGSDAATKADAADKESQEVAEDETTTESDVEKSSQQKSPEQKATPQQVTTSEQVIPVPDLGGSDSVDVIEISVSVGDEIAEGDSLIVVESDKASMEIPSPAGGTVLELKLAVGDKVSEGDAIVLLQVSAAAVAPAAKSVSPATSPASAPQPKITAPEASVEKSAVVETSTVTSGDGVYAGPAVRKLARQLGVDLTKVKPSGPRGRFSKEDLRNYVKQIVEDVTSGKVSSGSGIPPIPEVDFSQFGEIELEKMTKIAKLTAANMSRSWLNVPHVTQFDDADITELEAFRKSMKAEADKRGVKLTPLPFLLKASAAALQAEPSFNVSLHADGEHVVRKKYIHIGVAVDTPAGLMVPVIRDVDKKGLWELAEECAQVAEKARLGKLMPRDMQGGCFTISSLGAMGGNGFTPIVNAPEVAIMGVSKAQIKPIWNGEEFVPRQMLPLTVSYDHRAINGANCGRFFTYLVAVLGDIRRLLL